MCFSSSLLKFGLLSLLLITASFATDQTQAPLTTVAHVDLDRYMGEWYVIARYPDRSEKECESDFSAVYSPLKNGKIRIVESCRKKNGIMKEENGYAKVTDSKTNAKLNVTSLGPVRDYWIVDLDPDYRYAVVSEPKREYLWILSRTPQMPPDDYDQVLARIRELGFDSDRLIKSKQDAR
jgi:apolipoprotein D and lipocalin family protein